MKVDAIGHARVGDSFALPCQTAEGLVIPRLNRGDIAGRQKHVNVIHPNGPGYGGIAEDFDTHAIWSLDKPLPWIVLANRVRHTSRLPLRTRCIDVFKDKSEMVHYGSCRRSRRIALAQHNEYPRKLNERQRTILDA